MTNKMESKLEQIKSFLASVINLRSFVIILALFVLIFPTKVPFYERVNEVLFNIGSSFVSAPETEDEVVIIHLPKNLVENLTQRPVSVPNFNNYLYRLKRYRPVGIALIIENLPQTIIKDAYVKISMQFIRGRTKTALRMRKNFSDDFDGFNGKLADTIRKNNIFVGRMTFALSKYYNGLYSSFNINAPKLEVDYSGDQKYSGFKKVMNVLAGYNMPPKLPVLVSSTIPFSPYMKNYEIIPVSNSNFEISHPLVWKHKNGYLPDLTTQLYANLSGSKLPKWDNGTGLQFEFIKVRTGNDGRIQPLYSKKNKNIPYYSLSEILSRKNLSFLRDKIILIGKDQDAVLENTAYTLLSLRSGFASFTPNWSILFEKLIILLLLSLFIFLLPKTEIHLKILSSIGVIFLLVVLHFGFLAFFKILIPVSVALLFFVVCSALYILQNLYTNRFVGISREMDNAFLELGTLQFDNKQYDQSFITLRRCEGSDETLEIIYNIGIEFQRRNQFNKAIAVFSYINEKNSGFKDAAERMRKLSDFMRGKIKKKSGPGEKEETLDIPHIEMNRLVLGRYEIEKELGRGAMGIVYLGKDPKIGRHVAIKTLDFSKLIEGDLEVAKARFFREAKTIGMLNHPNIVVVYDVGEEDEIAYIAMDYVPGQTLDGFSKKKKLLPIPVVLQLMVQVADALDYAHRQNIIHRDIKPGNIIYNKNENFVKVTDFGIARMMDSSHTRSDIILGSPSYMSPEQLKGAKVDGRSDIFSLGVTLYQLLTGHYPFEGEDLATITYKITKTKQKNVCDIRSEIPEICSKIIEKALQKNPEKRFQTAKEMANAIRKSVEK